MNNPPKFDPERFRRQVEELDRRGRSDPKELTPREPEPPKHEEKKEAMRGAFVDELSKISADLTEQARAHIAKKNFAVSAGASNTGKPAYPIPDKQHAISALGFSKMHGDTKDATEVRKDVAAKFPSLVKKALSLSTVGSYLKKQTDPRALAGASKSLMGRGAQMVAGGGDSVAKGQKYLLGAGVAATRAAKTASIDTLLMASFVKAASTAGEIAGLGVLAIPGADTIQAKLRSRKHPEQWEKKRLLGEGTHALADVGGLGILAADTLRGHHK